MEKHIKKLYDDFNGRRRKHQALQADKDDLEELKQLEDEIKKNK